MGVSRDKAGQVMMEPNLGGGVGELRMPGSKAGRGWVSLERRPGAQRCTTEGRACKMQAPCNARAVVTPSPTTQNRVLSVRLSFGSGAPPTTAASMNVSNDSNRYSNVEAQKLRPQSAKRLCVGWGMAQGRPRPSAHAARHSGTHLGHLTGHITIHDTNSQAQLNRSGESLRMTPLAAPRVTTARARIRMSNREGG